MQNAYRKFEVLSETNVENEFTKDITVIPVTIELFKNSAQHFASGVSDVKRT